MIKKFTLAFILLLFTAVNAQIVEKFETGLPTSATTGTVSLSSGDWYISAAKRANPGRTGYGLTLNSGSSSPAYANTPIIASNQTVSFWARGSGASKIIVEKSTDNGNTFTPVTGSPITISSSFAEYSFTLNETSPGCIVKFKNGTSQSHVIDDVTLAIGNFPNITISTSALPSFGNIVMGTLSPSASYTVSGANLTNNITVTAPAAFSVSQDNTTFSQTLTLTQTGGIIPATPVYVRFNPATAAGKVTMMITNTSTGAQDKKVSVEGSALAVEPTMPSAIAAGTATGYTLTLNLSGGNGANRVVVAKEGSAVTWTPLDGKSITGADDNFAAAADQGGGHKVVFDSPDSLGGTVTVTGLAVATTYHFAVYDYNKGAAGSENYLTAQSGTASGTTLTVPGLSVTPGSLEFGNVLVNTTTPEKTYSLSGRFLSPAAGDISVAAPANFEISKTSGTGFSSSLTVPYTNGTLAAGTIYVRFKPTALTVYNGLIAHAGGTAADLTLAVSGVGKDSASLAKKEIYVSPTGNDVTGSGTMDNPYKTVYKAGLKLQNDYTLILRGGLYPQDSLILRNKALTNIAVVNYPGERPVIDGTTGLDVIVVYCSNSLFKGIEVTKAGHNSMWVMGHNNRVENCIFRDGGDSGFKTGSSGQTEYPRNTVVINCDAYRNYDTRGNGGNADGFSAKWKVGSGTKFIGCRAWENSDDGWDLWQAESTVVMENCWAFRNGHDVWHVGSDGNGNGFKIGGSPVNCPHVMTNCIAFDNKGSSGGKGFDQNSNFAGHTMLNCLSWGNSYLDFNFYKPSQLGTLVAKNCIQYKGTTSPYIKFVDGDIKKNSWKAFTWQTGYVWAGIAVTDNDFVSVDTSLARAPRNPDGSLPYTDLYKLKATSPLVNAGVDVGLPYFGSAPDIGPFEFGLTEVKREEQVGPRQFSLEQNYPNPFNPSTVIRFRIDKETNVKLAVYNALGQLVSVLAEGAYREGVYTASFDARDLSSGIYYCRLTSDRASFTKKMMLVR